MYYRFIVCILSFFLSVTASAATLIPQANTATSGLFLTASGYEIPSGYFSKINLSKSEGGTNSYTLTTYLNNASGGTSVRSLPVWASSLLAYPNNAAYFYEKYTGYPSFSEYSISYGQCVAFAKVATDTETYGTYQWYSDTKVMTPVLPVASTYDPSNLYQGRMVAYFGNANATTGTQYPQVGSGLVGHVGIFLKYAYDQTATWPRTPIGFWIADENYEGDASAGNLDGKIRKHLILFNPPNRPSGATPLGHTYADRYWFVKIIY